MLKNSISITNQIKEIVVQKDITNHSLDSEAKVGDFITRMVSCVVTTLLSIEDAFREKVSNHITGKTRKACLRSRIRIRTGSAAENFKNSREFNYRLFVTDKKTWITFFVDSGADVSLIPATCNDEVSGDFKLYAVNSTEIPCFGRKVLTIDLGLCRDFQCLFIIAKVNKGILGEDFLNRFYLLIDIKYKTLIYGVTKRTIIVEITSSVNDSNVSTSNKNNKFSNILAQKPEK